MAIASSFDTPIRVPRSALDRLEQLILAVGGAYLFYRMWPADLSYTSLIGWLLLFSEGAALLFVLLRKPTDEISPRFRDWAAAVAGSAGPLFVGAGAIPPIAYDLGVALLIAGIIIHIGAKLSLNVSFGIVAANRGVRSRWMYRLVRHPMYAGYMTSHLGYLLAAPSLWNLGVYAAVWAVFLARISAEERVLSEDAAYRAYKDRVRHRLIPGVV